jgi:hypothetical protein
MRAPSRVAAALALVAVGVTAGALSAERPDPQTQAVADGCGRNDAAAISNEIPEWAYVGDRDYGRDGPPPPPRWAHGSVNAFGPSAPLAVHTAGGDIPTTHRAYDLNLDVLPVADDYWLVGGNPSARTGNFEGEGEQTGRLHVELEETAIPMPMWPEPGDRVEVLGSWVWDCGHWLPGGERTELHPFRGLWVERSRSPRSASGEAEGDVFLTTEATTAGVIAECAHRTRGDRAAFKPCLATAPRWQDVTGDYRFHLTAPPRPGRSARLRWRVVDAGTTSTAPPLAIRRSGNGVDVSFTVPPSLGPAPRRFVLARRVLLGWTRVATQPEHLRVRFLRLLVRRAMDPACRADDPGCPARNESTRLGQQSALPGEWNVYWDVAGIWGMWTPRVLLVRRDGQAFRGRQAVDVFVPRGRPWRVLVWTRECDWGALGPLAPCPRSQEIGVRAGDDVPGFALARFRSPDASTGLHRLNSSLSGSTCPPSNRHGCYELTFRVSRVSSG